MFTLFTPGFSNILNRLQYVIVHLFDPKFGTDRGLEYENCIIYMITVEKGIFRHE